METQTLIAIGMFVAAGAALGYGYYIWRRLKLIAETPTSKVGEISAGTVEVEGTARSDGQTLTAPFSQQECVAYEYKVEEYRRKRSSSSSNNSSGRNKGTWKTVDSDSKVVPFRVVDETGEARVEPYGADVKLYNEKFSDEDSSGGGSMGSVGEMLSGGSRFGNRRRTEKHIGVDELVYVYGDADPGDEEVTIMESASAPMFLISDRMADQLVDTKKKTVAVAAVIGVVCAGVGTAILAGAF